MRHAERSDDPESDDERQIYIDFDCHITREGIQQAKRLGEYLKGILPEDYKVWLYTSPFLRCVQTSLGIISNLDLASDDAKIEDGLSEVLSIYKFPVNPFGNLFID